MQTDAADIKAGRKISASRMKSLKDASTSMKTAVKLLDAIIREAEGDGKGATPAQAAKRAIPRGRAAKQTKKTVEILF